MEKKVFDYISKEGNSSFTEISDNLKISYEDSYKIMLDLVSKGYLMEFNSDERTYIDKDFPTTYCPMCGTDDCTGVGNETTKEYTSFCNQCECEVLNPVNLSDVKKAVQV